MSVRFKTWWFICFVKLLINPLLLTFDLTIFSTGCLLKIGSNFGLPILGWLLDWVLKWFNYLDINFTSAKKFLITKVCNNFYYVKLPWENETTVCKINHELIWNSLLGNWLNCLLICIIIWLLSINFSSKMDFEQVTVLA